VTLSSMLPFANKESTNHDIQLKR